ncbi:MAG: SGNH/GDSL hydrolase family protein [Planctomycetota bacterium]
MESRQGSPTDSRRQLVAYLAGAFTSALCCTLLFAILFLKFGSRVAPRGNPLEWSHQHVAGQFALELPEDVLADCRKHQVVFENAHNPTNAKPHDTCLVRPDEKFGWVLNPNAQVSMHMLRSKTPLNLDPPLLAVPTMEPLTDRIKEYLKAQSRVACSYSVDSAGRRKTVPLVSDKPKIVLVGDSVCFGVMVSDENTIASRLQRLVGDGYQIVNAGVGGYQGPQALRAAEGCLDEGDCAAVVYVACQNDFFLDDLQHQHEVASTVLEKFSTLRSRFQGPIVVLLTTYLEHVNADLLTGYGWPAQHLDGTERLRAEIPTLCSSHGLKFIDLASHFQARQQSEGTIFEPMSLYVDHCHLSPRGSEVAARLIHDILAEEASMTRLTRTPSVDAKR